MEAGPDGLLLLDKPAGITSVQALAVARRALASRKAGHTGTLDPFATGLLPLVFGEATKFSRFLIDADKEYVATLALGAVSSTGDTEGVIQRRASPTASFDEVRRICASFLGNSMQVPPMHSALRVAGRRLYDLARAGVEVDRQPRQIRIDRLEVLRYEVERLVISVKCSKGTYIRSLAQDFGEALGCGAYLTGLRRTGIGRFRVEDAATPDELLAMGPATARARLLPVGCLVESLPRIDLAERDAQAVRNGQEVGCGIAAPEGEVAVFGPDGRLVGVGKVSSGRLAPHRLMATGAG